MSLPKVLAYYLPQFHQIPENDAWWGKGFTEWTAVKKGRPLFPEHQQPRIPLNSNYYDLTDKSVVEWQAHLARTYRVYGFVIYHYWFQDGRRILERPAEALLKWTDIDIPFCFDWANQTWARTWSNLIGEGQNTWADAHEGNASSNEDAGILLKQRYGDEEDWINHLQYMLPFFKDKRYIKKDNRPLFVIYRPEEIHCLPDMVDCWNSLLRKNGFDGLYIIGEIMGAPMRPPLSFDAWLVRSPNFSMSLMTPQTDSPKIYDYDMHWKKLLTYNWNSKDFGKVYLSAAVDHDTTPRRGTSGELLHGASTEKFHRYFKQLFDLNICLENDFLFINAWNEWGEGMYLEPDEVHGYGYLEAVRNTIESKPEHHSLTEIFPALKPDAQKQLFYNRWQICKHSMITFSRWMRLRKNGKNVAAYLAQKGYKEVAIYGLGHLGKHLLNEFEGQDVQIKYIIDRNQRLNFGSYPFYNLSSSIPKVDAIIVTPAGQYKEIRQHIKQHAPWVHTVSLEHIIFELS